MRPETWAKYLKNWPEISKATIEDRGKRCEKCGVRPGNPYPVLTTHYRDHEPGNNEESNKQVLCQACHLDEEREYIRQARKLELIARGQLELPRWPE